MKLRAAGVDTSTNYQRQTLFSSNTTVSGARSTAQTQWAICALSTSAEPTFVQIELTNPFASAVTGGCLNSDTYYGNVNIEKLLLSLGQNSTSSFDGFTLLPSTGTITGTAIVYGYQE